MTADERVPFSVVLMILCFAGSLRGAEVKRVNAVTAGEFLVDPPTLINLGFEWMIAGDENRNAAVQVSYRKKGDSQWKQALPLLRLQNEEIYQGDRMDVVSPNMFAGSILDLEPDTEYEAQFVMTDPDGVKGAARKTVTVRTRPEPKPFAGGKVYHVYPHGYKGAKQEPAFEGLLCAYYLTCAGTDWATASRPRVKPGDTILVHAGLYKYNRNIYTNDLSISTVPFDGTYYLTASGTPDKPIAIKAAGDGEAIFDGAGAFALFDLKAGNYTYFEGLTIRNAEVAFWAGTQFITGSKGLTVKHCRIEDVGMGVYSNFSGSKDFYIADNYIIGRNDPNHMIGWSGNFWEQFAGTEGQVFPPKMASYIAVKIYGSGHVVAYNYVANFHDGIDVETYGNPDGSSAIDGPKYPPKEYWDRRPVSIDFYNNYMTNFHDNPFEIDGSMHNIRVMRNMMVNSASQPFCNQPALGGPVYWIRNIAYNAPGGAARLSGGSGIFFYNNTIFSEVAGGTTSNTHWRNNLVLAQNSIVGFGGGGRGGRGAAGGGGATDGETGPGRGPAGRGGAGAVSNPGASAVVFGFSTYTNYTSSDYNGFRPNSGAPYAFEWNSPPATVVADYSRRGHNATLETRRFKALDEYQKATGQDQHSILVDYDSFVNVPKLDGRDVKTVQRLYKAGDYDFRLKPNSPAIDRGVALPNVTDGYSGKAPDLGAIELGQEASHYGPRQ
ncbi:MAG: hypothetical protein ABI759_11660 [Candidatus Solibacter sp.]